MTTTVVWFDPKPSYVWSESIPLWQKIWLTYIEYGYQNFCRKYKTTFLIAEWWLGGGSVAVRLTWPESWGGRNDAARDGYFKSSSTYFSGGTPSLAAMDEISSSESKVSSISCPPLPAIRKTEISRHCSINRSRLGKGGVDWIICSECNDVPIHDWWHCYKVNQAITILWGGLSQYLSDQRLFQVPLDSQSAGAFIGFLPSTRVNQIVLPMVLEWMFRAPNRYVCQRKGWANSKGY